MNKLIAFSILIIFTFSKNSYSANIAVIDIEDLIISNNFYIKIISEINLDQEYFSEIFKKKEKELEELQKEIDNAKLILDNQEINKMINNYNIELSKFSILFTNNIFSESTFNWIFNLIDEFIKFIFFHSSSYFIFITSINSLTFSSLSKSKYLNSFLKFDFTELTLNFEKVL